MVDSWVDSGDRRHEHVRQSRCAWILRKDGEVVKPGCLAIYGCGSVEEKPG
jgi:hypothetical protein